MARDPGILCFRHCSSKSIFCKTVPRMCPICQSCIVDYSIDPFLIPYPYTNATHHSAALVVRPSRGSFLNDYRIFNDLHIGLTNSRGIVFEYDTEGLIINDRSKWRDCIAIKIVPSSWDDHWDGTLETMLKNIKWKSESYDPVTMNCFNFVIEFINSLQYMNMSFVNKETMCNELILSRIQDAIKYNSVYKKLEVHDYCIS